MNVYMIMRLIFLNKSMVEIITIVFVFAFTITAIFIAIINWFLRAL